MIREQGGMAALEVGVKALNKALGTAFEACRPIILLTLDRPGCYKRDVASTIFRCVLMIGHNIWEEL